MSGRYDRRTPSLDDPGHPWARLAARVRPGASVLDLGCWDGTLGALLRDRLGARVVGVERDAEAAGRARARGLEVVAADLGLPGWERALSGRRFDAVVMADVVEHLADPLAALRTVRDAVLAPGGEALLSVPNVAHGSVRLALLLGDFDGTETGILDSTHLRFFTRRSLLALLREAGLRVASIEDVRRDVAEDVARPLLARAGIADPAVLRLVTADPDAVAYQFVVAAVLADPASIPPPPPARGPDVVRVQDRVVRGQAAKIRRLEERLATLEAGTPFAAWRYAWLRARQALRRRR